MNILKESNDELEMKIKSAYEQYNMIMERLSLQPSYQEEREILEKKLKAIERELAINVAEMDGYKRNIDSLKNKLEFKLNIEKAMNLENILKSEMSKGKIISKEIETITKMNNLQIKTLNHIDKENRFTEKIEILKNEVKNLKDNLKDNMEKFTKQEKYIKSLHEKISHLENQIKKLNQPKVEVKKNFTKEDLKKILESLNTLKVGINHKREVLKDLNKTNEDKLMSFISLNKRIEQDYKENEKVK